MSNNNKESLTAFHSKMNSAGYEHTGSMKNIHTGAIAHTYHNKMAKNGYIAHIKDGKVHHSETYKGKFPDYHKLKNNPTPVADETSDDDHHEDKVTAQHRKVDSAHEASRNAQRKKMNESSSSFEIGVVHHKSDRDGVRYHFIPKDEQKNGKHSGLGWDETGAAGRSYKKPTRWSVKHSGEWKVTSHEEIPSHIKKHMGMVDETIDIQAFQKRQLSKAGKMDKNVREELIAEVSRKTLAAIVKKSHTDEKELKACRANKEKTIKEALFSFEKKHQRIGNRSGSTHRVTVKHTPTGAKHTFDVTAPTDHHAVKHVISHMRVHPSALRVQNVQHLYDDMNESVTGRVHAALQHGAAKTHLAGLSTPDNLSTGPAGMITPLAYGAAHAVDHLTGGRISGAVHRASARFRKEGLIVQEVSNDLKNRYLDKAVSAQKKAFRKPADTHNLTSKGRLKKSWTDSDEYKNRQEKFEKRRSIIQKTSKEVRGKKQYSDMSVNEARMTKAEYNHKKLFEPQTPGAHPFAVEHGGSAYMPSGKESHHAPSGEHAREYIYGRHHLYDRVWRLKDSGKIIHDRDMKHADTKNEDMNTIPGAGNKKKLLLKEKPSTAPDKGDASKKSSALPPPEEEAAAAAAGAKDPNTAKAPKSKTSENVKSCIKMSGRKEKIDTQPSYNPLITAGSAGGGNFSQ